MKLKTTVTAFIFHKGNLLLIKHKKTGKWLHVGGHAEPDETLDETLRREVKEEVNLDVEFLEEFNYYGNIKFPKDFRELPCPFYIHVTGGKERKMSFDFVCFSENIDNIKIQDSEIGKYKWFSKAELLFSSKIGKEIKILALKAFEVYEKWIKEGNKSRKEGRDYLNKLKDIEKLILIAFNHGSYKKGSYEGLIEKGFSKEEINKAIKELKEKEDLDEFEIEDRGTMLCPMYLNFGAKDLDNLEDNYQK